MTDTAGDTRFAGSIPELYERILVPLIFQPYATDLAVRLAALAPDSVLEVAAGTGVVTRAMADSLPAASRITATDLNQPMVDLAAGIGTSRPVTWRQADVMALPFDDASFDVVVCQFGVMFFPDRVAAYQEVRRVLRPGGTFLFNTWDRIEANEFALVTTQALATVFPDDPPDFMARVPHGYHDEARIRGDLVAAGFAASAPIEALEARSRAATCDIAAIGYCQGTPVRNAIEARDPARLTEATEAAAAAIRERFGATNVDGGIRAYVIQAHAG
jgi:SAM-dependent methyltransferase